MPELFTGVFADGAGNPWFVLARLTLALLFGAAVAWTYKRTTKSDLGRSLPITLVLLTVLIAMVTQVIGDSVARAFSLVGALSIVRFRTVVRDTRDTAYVIFAVVMGMAVSARSLWVAVMGFAVVTIAAFIASRRSAALVSDEMPFTLTVRVRLGLDAEQALGGILREHARTRELLAVSLARQGSAIETVYRVCLDSRKGPDELVLALNRIDGVQDVRLCREGYGD